MQASGKQIVIMILGAAVLVSAPPLSAQRVRIRSTTTARYIALSPLVLDSAGDFTSGPRQAAAPLTEDIELSAWGLGLEGLRAYGLVRLRGAIGNAVVWPRSNDHFDALQAFVELERPRWRARVGRQQRVSSLGFYAFDGGSAQWRPRPTLRLEGFAGRGMARGFLEPLSSDAIRSIDPLRPDQGTLFLGLNAWAAPARGWTASAAWQKELLADRSGLVSERVALEARGPLGGGLSITAAADGDLAAEAVGRARLAVHWSGPRLEADAEVFRYRPVFDLTTIWGVFAPEAHHGFSLRAEGRASRRILLRAGVTHRRYRPAFETTPFLVGVADHATAFDVGGAWTLPGWTADARWRLFKGYGGSQSGGDLAVTRAPAGGRWEAGLRATVFKEVEQFRVADGVVAGLGAHGVIRVTPLLRVRAEAARYWHNPSAGDVMLDWSQLRALLSVEWTFGADADRVGSFR